MNKIYDLNNGFLIGFNNNSIAIISILHVPQSPEPSSFWATLTCGELSKTAFYA